MNWYKCLNDKWIGFHIKQEWWCVRTTIGTINYEPYYIGYNRISINNEIGGVTIVPMTTYEINKFKMELL